MHVSNASLFRENIFDLGSTTFHERGKEAKSSFAESVLINSWKREFCRGERNLRTGRPREARKMDVRQTACRNHSTTSNKTTDKSPKYFLWYFNKKFIRSDIYNGSLRLHSSYRDEFDTKLRLKQPYIENIIDFILSIDLNFFN